MHPSLQRNVFFVKEHVGMFKASNNYDILDPETQQPLLFCREPNLGFFTKMFRFTDYKRMTPFEVVITDTDNKTILTVKRGITLIRSVVEVFDENNVLIGKFKQKFFSIGGKFDVLDPSDNVVCTLKGKWTGWDFQFTRGTEELGRVTKKWAGLGKELFTTADNYVLSINENVGPKDSARQLILAAVMCIDMVLKE